MMRRALLVAAAGAALSASPALAAPALAPVWSDHIVLQQGKPIVVEGTDDPGAQITATLGGARGIATADASGHFRIGLPARKASFDPLTLSVSDGSGKTTISDILVGDVWLCSGQSNMELQVIRALDSYNQIAASADDNLRLLTVPKFTAAMPSDSFGGPVEWVKAGPKTVPDFSAACFYMAQRLRKDLKIPIGAIHSSWGGSQIRAWETPEAGLALYGPDQMAQLKLSTTDMLGAVTGFAKTWGKWWRDHSDGAQPWLEPEKLDWNPVPKISAWGEWTGTPLAKNGNGNVWFRRTITLTPEQAKAGGTLNIGLVDDTDMTFVNGHPVGNTSSWSDERHYPVPASYLKAGANEVVLLVTNSWGAGGLESKPERLTFDVAGGASIPLGKGWQYSISPVTDYPPRSPWDGIAGIGVMQNKMIAPLGHIALKGVAWYQGESDAGIPGYAGKLKQLFAGWRRQFGDDLRMIVVQLPNWGPVAEKPMKSDWAELREEQREAVAADRDAALAPALDIGDRTQLHPANKIELGRRMARLAEGERFPEPLRAVRESGRVRLSFSGIQGGLHTWSGPFPLAVQLCAATLESCRYVVAAVDGDSLIIPDDGKPATRIRYAWADSPVVNLYDGRDLPPPTFEIPIED
jgi:sialate O-acetylesterase